MKASYLKLSWGHNKKKYFLYLHTDTNSNDFNSKQIQGLMHMIFCLSATRFAKPLNGVYWLNLATAIDTTVLH